MTFRIDGNLTNKQVLETLQGLPSQERIKSFDKLEKQEIQDTAKIIDGLFQRGFTSKQLEENTKLAEILSKLSFSPLQNESVAEKTSSSWKSALQRIGKAAKRIFTAPFEKAYLSLKEAFGHVDGAILDKKLQGALERKTHLEPLQTLFIQKNQLEEELKEMREQRNSFKSEKQMASAKNLEEAMAIKQKELERVLDQIAKKARSF